MKLFVDDSRQQPAGGFECCVTAAQAKMLLSFLTFDFITLDYDLGRDSETGLDILKWMVENDKTAPHINIHSTHAEGRAAMQTYALAHFPASKITMNPLP